MIARLERRQEWAAIVVLAAGAALLAARPFVPSLPDTRIALLAVSYVVIGVASVAVPVEPGRPHLARAAVLVVGVAAIAIAARAGGGSIPVPWGAAALPLSLLAAVAEEALFRRVAYGRLERFGAGVAIVGSTVLFGLVHLPAYGPAALPVDVGAGLLLGWQRWASGTWTVPAATHAAANALTILG